MIKSSKNKKIIKIIIFAFFIILISSIFLANYLIAPYITDVEVKDSLRFEDKKVINVYVKNYFFKLNKKTYCILTTNDSIPNVNDKNWVEASDGYCSFIVDADDYNIYVKDKYGNMSDINNKSVKNNKLEKIPMNKDTIYLYRGAQEKVQLKGDYSKIKWVTEDKDIAVVDDGVVTGISEGTTTIKAEVDNNKYASLKVIVTNLITKPDVTTKKNYIKCKQFSNEEAQMLDDILESKIADAGYQTRAGVVAAARFLTLDFAYRVHYFYENGRLENYAPYEYVDGEGRYYHKGLYLSTTKYKDLKASFVGPAIWGCNLQNYTDWNGVYVTGQFYPNGFDCSGFVTWALLNGGFDVGDIGAGTDPNHKDLTDLGEKVYISNELMNSGRVKVGDLIGLDGHMAILAGWDENNYYIAESLNTTGGVVMTTVARNKLVYNSIYKYIILMDNVYKTDGNLTNKW